MSTPFVSVAVWVSTVGLVAALVGACRRDGRSPEGAAAPLTELEAPTAAQVPPREPSIDFDTRVHDFGLVNEGTPLKHIFEVRNKGTAPLVLSEVRTSCGCTQATLGTSTLAPGSSGPLEVSMDTHFARGQESRNMTVISNDPLHPTSTLEITYNVQPLLGLDRSYLHLTATHGTNRVEKIWLTGQLVKQARLRIVEGGGERPVTARIIETREAGQPRKGLQLELRGRHPASGEGTLTVKTGLPLPSELSLHFEYAVE